MHGFALWLADVRLREGLMFSLYGFFFAATYLVTVGFCAVGLAFALANDPLDWERWSVAVLFGAFCYKEFQS